MTASTNTVFVVTVPSEGTVLGVFSRASDALEQSLDHLEQTFPVGKFVHYAEPEYDHEDRQTIFVSCSNRTDGYYAHRNVRYVITEIPVDTWMGS